jgi:hypothetical protein
VASLALSTGAIFSRPTLGGLVNALAGAEDRAMDTLTCMPLAGGAATALADQASRKAATQRHGEEAVATAAEWQLQEVVGAEDGAAGGLTA